METQVALGIVAHTARATQAVQLADMVAPDLLSTDDGSLGCTANHLAVLQRLAGSGARHVAVLEDDAQPMPGFREQLHAALDVAPAPIVSLYLGRGRPQFWQRHIKSAIDRANHHGAHWIRGTSLLHAVGYAIRADLIPDLLRYESRLPIDQHTTSFSQRYGYAVAYTHGSLVDHADGESVTRHRDGQIRVPGRTAWQVGGHDTWNATAVTLR